MKKYIFIFISFYLMSCSRYKSDFHKIDENDISNYKLSNLRWYGNNNTILFEECEDSVSRFNLCRLRINTNNKNYVYYIVDVFYNINNDTLVIKDIKKERRMNLVDGYYILAEDQISPLEYYLKDVDTRNADSINKIIQKVNINKKGVFIISQGSISEIYNYDFENQLSVVTDSNVLYFFNDSRAVTKYYYLNNLIFDEPNKIILPNKIDN